MGTAPASCLVVVLLVVAVGCVVLVSACAVSPDVFGRPYDKDEPLSFTFTVETKTPLNTVSDAYASFTVDLGSLSSVNLSDPRLMRLVRHIRDTGPVFLRVGGTFADHVYYTGFDGEKQHWNEENHKKSQAKKASAAPLPPGYTANFTPPMWNSLINASRTLDLDLVFGLNGGLGPRYHPNDRSNTTWNSSNAESLIRYAAMTKQMPFAWELGNEPNSYESESPSYTVTPRQLARDFYRLHLLLRDVGKLDTPRLIGPDVSTSRKATWHYPLFVNEFTSELSTLAEAQVHAQGSSSSFLYALSYHYYPMGYASPMEWNRATLEKFTNPGILNAIKGRASANLAAVFSNLGSASGTQVWIGETSSVSGGGLPHASDTFASGFWYLDQLGSFAAHSGGSGKAGVRNAVMVRQQLVGVTPYVLVRMEKSKDFDNDNTDKRRRQEEERVRYTPNPDYFSLILWRRFMGTRVLSASIDKLEYTESLRVYAHCTPSSSSSSSTTPRSLDGMGVAKTQMKQAYGNITVLFINLYDSCVHVNLTFNDHWNHPNEVLAAKNDHHNSSGRNERPGKIKSSGPVRKEYHLTPYGKGGIQSQRMALNGVPLILKKNQELPAFDPVLVPADSLVKLAARSYAFVVFPSSPENTACASASTDSAT